MTTMQFTRRAALAAMIAAGATATIGRSSAHALETEAAESFVKNVAERLIALVRSPQEFEAKRVAFRDLLNEAAAMPLIGRIAIGAPWRQMSDPQKTEYISVLTEYLSRIYTKRFAEYSGETLAVVGSSDRGKKGVFVQTRVERAGSEPLKVEWRVTDRTGSIQILDIYVEGVSLLITQREDFRGQLEKNGNDIDAFLARLKSLSAG